MGSLSNHVHYASVMTAMILGAVRMFDFCVMVMCSHLLACRITCCTTYEVNYFLLSLEYELCDPILMLDLFWQRLRDRQSLRYCMAYVSACLTPPLTLLSFPVSMDLLQRPERIHKPCRLVPDRWQSDSCVNSCRLHIEAMKAITCCSYPRS